MARRRDDPDGAGPPSGLPRPVERFAMRHLGGTPSRRIGAAAALRALAVLLRQHPRVAAEMLGAGLRQAGRASWIELRGTQRPRLEAAKPEIGDYLSKADRRRLRALMKAHSRRKAAPPG